MKYVSIISFALLLISYTPSVKRVFWSTSSPPSCMKFYRYFGPFSSSSLKIYSNVISASCWLYGEVRSFLRTSSKFSSILYYYRKYLISCSSSSLHSLVIIFDTVKIASYLTEVELLRQAIDTLTIIPLASTALRSCIEFRTMFDNNQRAAFLSTWLLL